MSDELRQVIRKMLLNELEAQGLTAGPRREPVIRVEEVEINTDRDLEQLVRRLVTLARTPDKLADIEAGRHVFRLRPSRMRPGAGRAPGGGSMHFDNELITEKRVRSLPDGVSVVRLSGSARLTPLANDALRRAGIKIIKVKS
jgi:hypothetical protein